ncbi:MAG: hypothetical protein CBD16_05605 [Betaproteobacteria bacterium TMED156]|nr:MAG: hypothetical protein CBD16_05605 [Betaproteobacteria bacterium TMED156]
MKYKDKNLSIEAQRISFFDTDRPVPALTMLFNPTTNQLRAQSASLINRVAGISHEIEEKINLGILDETLHCILPILAYFRKKKYQDTNHILFNKLVIKETEFARDLIMDSTPNFYKTQVDILDSIFSEEGFILLVINIKDEEPLMTAIDRMKHRRGMISIHNPEFKDNVKILKYCLDRKLYLIEHTDNSADLLRI